MWHNGRTDLVPIVEWEGTEREGGQEMISGAGTEEEKISLPFIASLSKSSNPICLIRNIMNLLYPSNTILQ